MWGRGVSCVSIFIKGGILRNRNGRIMNFEFIGTIYCFLNCDFGS